MPSPYDDRLKNACFLERLLLGESESRRPVSGIDDEYGTDNAAIIIFHRITQMHQPGMLFQILQVRRPGFLPEFANVRLIEAENDEEYVEFLSALRTRSTILPEFLRRLESFLSGSNWSLSTSRHKHAKN